MTADTRFDGPSRPSPFPTATRLLRVRYLQAGNRVLAHQAAGRQVVFIGDGESDRYAAGYADVVFAKDSLARFCLERGWPFEPWTTFAEIHAGWTGGWRRSRRTRRRWPAGRAAPVLRGRGLGARSVDPPPSDALPPHEGRVPG